ncbi:MAG: response regulator [Alphaproteobacteria bacterium]
MPACNILLVEDNHADALIVRTMLGMGGGSEFNISHAQTLSDGIDQLSSASFDIALLDHGLPDSSGTDGVKRVSEMHREMPVIVLTGNDDRNLPFEALRAGAQDFVTKDILMNPMAGREALLRSIHYALARKKHAAIEESLRDLGDADETLMDLVAGQSESSATARAIGQESVARSAPELFNDLLTQYDGALRESLEDAAHEGRMGKPEILQSIGESIGKTGGTARDVVAVHVATLKNYRIDHNAAEVRLATVEARLMLVEAMSYLASYYRTQTLRGLDAHDLG